MAANSCCLCAWRDRGEAAIERARVHSNVARHAHQDFAMWRCPRCRSLHSEEGVDLDRYYQGYPFSDQPLTYAAACAFICLLYRLHRQGIRPRHRILDFGCGAGQMVSFLRRCGFRGVSGYDKYTPRFADGAALKETYDAITAMDVVEHFEQPSEFFRATAQALRPGGLLYVTTPNADEIDLQQLDAFGMELHQPFHRHLLSPQALIRVALEYGLTPIRVIRRFCYDTPFPGVNARFIAEYVRRTGGMIDVAVEPPRLGVVATSPRLSLLLLLGALKRRPGNIQVLFRKQDPQVLFFAGPRQASAGPEPKERRMAQSAEKLGRGKLYQLYGSLDAENHPEHKVSFCSEVDLSSAQRLRHQQQPEGAPKPSYTALVAKAVARALREHPRANRIAISGLRGQTIYQLHTVDIAVAVERGFSELEDAVFVSVLRDVDTKDLSEVTRELLALRDSRGGEHPDWQTFRWIAQYLPVSLAARLLSLPRHSARLWTQHRGGAVIISSPSKYGVDSVAGTWPWPLGFSHGLIKQRHRVDAKGKSVVRLTTQLTMSFDRRLMVGAPAARFFARVCELLQNAEESLTAERDEAIRVESGTPELEEGLSESTSAVFRSSTPLPPPSDRRATGAPTSSAR